jgi:glucans biosynthesis protein C
MRSSGQVVALEKTNSNSVENIRILATILLVTFHVIGFRNSGLGIEYPHPLRIFADLFGDFRMPAFAFVAGFVYAIRPPSLDGFASFAIGKLRRLAIPGLIAALIFNALSLWLDKPRAIPVSDLWQIVVFPFAHYWFLQAVLLLFAIVGIIDALTKHRAEMPLLAIAVLLYLFTNGTPTIFAAAHAIGLAPFFVFGICYYRRSSWIADHSRPITLLAVALIGIWLIWNILDYARTGLIAPDHRQVQGLIFGTSLCTLMLFYIPAYPAARTLGRLCFTIYLYHVLGTAGMRTLLYALGVESLAVHLIAGVAAGLLLPIAIHLVAIRHPLTSRLLLGIRQNPAGAAVLKPIGPGATPRQAVPDLNRRSGT